MASGLGLYLTIVKCSVVVRERCPVVVFAAAMCRVYAPSGNRVLAIRPWNAIR